MQITEPVIPTLTNKGSGYEFTWSEYQLIATVKHITEGKDGTLKCQLTLTTTDTEYNPHLIQQIYNLSSPRAQSTLKALMLQKYKRKVDWDSVLEQLSILTLERMRTGIPTEELWTDDKIVPPEYELYPILPRGEPSLLYANGGSGKTYVSLFIASCLILPWKDNPLALVPRCGAVLLLDYENNRNTTLFRLKRIRDGIESTQSKGLAEYALNYRRCVVPLDKEIDKIVAEIQEKNIQTVIVDSAFGACNGDLNDNATAKTFFQAVRLMNCTVLILHHTAKGLKKSDEKTAYGSAYFHNAVRSEWELVSESEPGSSVSKLALFNRKSNDSRTHKPIGIEITFADPAGPVSFKPCDLDSTPELADSLPLSNRILNDLKHGALTIKDISDSLNQPYANVKARLNDLKRTGKVIKVGEKHWGLPYEKK